MQTWGEWIQFEGTAGRRLGDVIPFALPCHIVPGLAIPCIALSCLAFLCFALSCPPLPSSFVCSNQLIRPRPLIFFSFPLFLHPILPSSPFYVVLPFSPSPDSLPSTLMCCNRLRSVSSRRCIRESPERIPAHWRTPQDSKRVRVSVCCSFSSDFSSSLFTYNFSVVTYLCLIITSNIFS